MFDSLGIQFRGKHQAIPEVTSVEKSKVLDIRDREDGMGQGSERMLLDLVLDEY